MIPMYLLNECILCITTNLLLTKALGLSLLGKQERVGGSRWLICLFLTIFCTFGASAAFLLEPFLADTSVYLRPLMYILSCAVLYAVCLFVCGFLPQQIRKRAASALHQSAFSCAVMGVCLLTAENAGSLTQAWHFGLRCGIGMLLTGWMMDAAAPYLNCEKCPQAVRGWPAMLIYIGVLSMAASCLIRTVG